MPRYLKKPTTRRRGIEGTIDREMEQYRNQILRELKREGERTIKQFQEELRKSLNDEIKRTVTRARGASGDAGEISSGIGGIASLLGTIVNLYLSRPRVSRTSSETERSRNEAQQFRVSRAQALADAATTMQSANKNL